MLAGPALVAFYTDWLWFQEVGYAGVFVTILSLRGWLFIGVGLGTFLFLYANLALAARTARPARPDADGVHTHGIVGRRALHQRFHNQRGDFPSI